MDDIVADPLKIHCIIWYQYMYHLDHGIEIPEKLLTWATQRTQSYLNHNGMSEDRERTGSRHQTDEHKTRTDEHRDTTQDTNCSQSERTRFDKDTTLVNLASTPNRLDRRHNGEVRRRSLPDDDDLDVAGRFQEAGPVGGRRKALRLEFEDELDQY